MIREKVIAAVLAALLAGCGYTTSSIIADNARTICVENFKNKIPLTEEVTGKRMYTGYRSGMEVAITRDIIDRFVIDGNLRIADAANADLTLKGDLIDFSREALRYDNNDNIIEYRLKVIVDLRLINNSTGKEIVREKRFTGETSYRTTGALAKSEEAAIREAEADLAKRVVERVVEGW